VMRIFVFGWDCIANEFWAVGFWTVDQHGLGGDEAKEEEEKGFHVFWK
jgi:hypothetical protein